VLLAHNAVTTPKASLSLTFDPDDPNSTTWSSGTEYIYVGVRNEGTLRAEDVRLVLDEIDPPVRATLRQRFLVDGAESFKVSPTHGRSALYVSILSQSRHASYGHTHLVLTKRPKSLPPKTGHLRMVLRLDTDHLTEPLELNFVADEQGRTTLGPTTTRGSQPPE